jgi:3-hydroxyisobutyrate dehydrogenase
VSAAPDAKTAVKNESAGGAAPNVDDRVVAFIGLGNMGGPVAEHLCRDGYTVHAFDLNSAFIDTVVSAGGTAAASVSAATAAPGVSIIFVCVVNEKQLRSVVLGSDGILESATPGQIIVVHSSVLPEAIYEIQAAAEAVGLTVIDAPVSGARPAAEAGTLTVIVGGDPEVIDRCRPAMASYSQRVVRMGQLGAGEVSKILNNVIFHGTHLLVLEALRLAEVYGIDEEALLDAVRTSTGNCWVVENMDYMDDILFSHTAAHTETMYENVTKEMWNAVLLGRKDHVPLPITAVGVEVSRQMHIDREALIRVRDNR